MKYRVTVIERGTSGPPIPNGLRFDTWDEANEYGAELLSRWSGIIAYHVEEVPSA